MGRVLYMHLIPPASSSRSAPRFPILHPPAPVLRPPSSVLRPLSSVLQVGRIQGYRGETKVATVEFWRYDKDWLEKALDQDDENLPLVMPTSKSKYRIMYQAVNGKNVPLHLQ
eukprot:1594187-Rhodomonas_salina.1